MQEGNALVTLTDREQALRFLISTLPATSLAEAAVQLGTASTFAGILHASDWRDPATHHRLNELHDALNRIMLSVLPAVAAAAGLDLAAMCWDDLDRLRASLFYATEERA